MWASFRRRGVWTRDGKKKRAGAILLALTMLSSGTRPGALQSPSPRFSTSTAAVVVDVVVRDSQQRPIVGLAASDFKVYEDGVEQTITSFDEIGADTRAGPATSPAPGDVSTVRSDGPIAPAVVALVFEQLSPEGRRIATQAANSFLVDRLSPTDYFGVFFVDRAIHALAPYSHDRAVLQHAIEEASLRAGYPIEHAGRTPGAQYGSFEAGQPSQSTSDDQPQIRGHATLDALDQLIASLAPLPGRKAIALFSEGLALQPPEDPSLLPTGRAFHDSDSWLEDNRQKALLSLVERANRAHVAFYTFDAGGLRIEDANVRHCSGCAPYIGLKLLADQTGGAFVENTNDLAPGTRRVADDLHRYYLLGYTSTNPRLDDKYRRIQVKVRRHDVTVLARKGYVASPKREPSPVRSYEIGPLLALENPRVDNTFPFEAGTLAFPGQDAGTRTAVLARVPVSSLTWAREAVGENAHLAVLARVKDARGRLVTYASARYDLGRDAEGAGTADVLFYRDAALAPGVYTLEVAAYDEPSGRASVRLVTINVPKLAERGPRVGSVFLVSRADPEPKPTAGDLPETLRAGGRVLVPNLGARVDVDADLMFAFVVQTTPSGTGQLHARAMVMSNGAPVAVAPIALPPPDTHGRIAYVGNLRTDTFAAGTYQLVVSVADETGTTTRDVSFRIAR